MAAPDLSTSTYPAAGLDQRFYAFLLDRLIAWALFGAAAWLAWAVWWDDGSVLPGLLLLLAVVLLVSGAYAAVLGVLGTSPGKAAMGLRVVHHGTGTPIGLGPAMLRTLVVGVATLPTFGLGLATLAQTAVMDPGRQRRGWHDRISHGIVVDVRPAPVEVEQAEEGPRHIVNLTAMRLVPASAAKAVTPAPPRAPRPAPAATPQPLPPTAAVPVPAPAAAPGRPVVPPGPPPAGQPSLPPGPPPASLPPLRPSPAGPPPPRPAGSTTAERTVIRGPGGGAAGGSHKRLAAWRITFDTGETFLVEGLGLIGRKPEPRPGEPVRHLVALPSTDMSLSKTHAQFQVAPDGVLVVMDRGSTNGSTLVRSGVSRGLPVGRPTTLVDGDEVKFGDRSMKVYRED